MMNQLIKYLSMGIVSSMVLACGNNVENDIPIISPVNALEKSLEPRLLRETKPSTWIDANKNGISDEIDAYIKINYTGAADKTAAEQYARNLKPSDLLSSTNTVSKSKPKPVECVFYAFDVKHKKPRPKPCNEVVIPSNTASVVAELETSGDIPKLERTNTLAGIDNDKNGIRDDIDTYIQKNYSQLEQRKAVEQLAKAMQLTLLTNLTDTVNLKKISIQGDKALNCVFLKFGRGIDNYESSKALDAIESITTNTKPRLLAYLAYNKALNGMAFMLQEGDTCE
jgi:hypothetical protein